MDRYASRCSRCGACDGPRGISKKVIGPGGNTKRIDAYIPETHVLIEQKSLGIALDKPQPGHNEFAACQLVI